MVISRRMMADACFLRLGRGNKYLENRDQLTGNTPARAFPQLAEL